MIGMHRELVLPLHGGVDLKEYDTADVLFYDTADVAVPGIHARMPRKAPKIAYKQRSRQTPPLTLAEAMTLSEICSKTALDLIRRHDPARPLLLPMPHLFTPVLRHEKTKGIILNGHNHRD